MSLRGRINRLEVKRRDNAPDPEQDAARAERLAEFERRWIAAHDGQEPEHDEPITSHEQFLARCRRRYGHSEDDDHDP